MPEPQSSQVHVNRPLTNISQAYMQDASDYIADKVFPVVPVQKQSDRYFVYTKGDWFRDEAQLRAPGTESAGGGYNIDNTPSYYAPVYAYHKDVDPQIRANTDIPLNADRDATLFVTQRMLLKREILFTTVAMTTSTWTGSTTGGDITVSPLWSSANSTPLEDIEAQVWAIKQGTGKFPNRFLPGARVWEVLKNHDEIVQRIKYTQRGVVTTDLLASLIAPPGVDDFRVLVPAAIQNTAAEGATDSFSFISPTTSALLVYTEPNPGIMVPSAGYIFTWVGLLGAGAFGSRISQIPTPLLGIGSVRTEGELAFSTKIVGADLGVWFAAAVSA
jgi:Phage major capsid protein E